MDPQQFQLFLDQLTKISSRLDAIYNEMPEPEDKNKDKGKIERLQPKEKERQKEIAKIYSKEFEKNFEKLNKKQKELFDENQKIFQKNGIKVRLEFVSRDVLRNLKKIFSESVAGSLAMQTAGGGKKGGGMAGAAGNFLGNLIGGAGPWGAIIAAIAAVGGVAIIYLLLQNLDKLASFMKDALPAIGDFLVKVLPPAIESAGKAISTVVLPLMKALVENVVKLADTFLTHIPPILKSIGDILLPILNNVKEFFMFIISNIPTIVDAFFGGISKLTEIILTNLPPIMPYLVQIAGFVKEIGMSLIDKIPIILNTFKDVFLPTLTAIKDIILALIPPLKDILSEVIKGITLIAPYVKDILISAFNNLKDILTSLFVAIQPLLQYIGPVFMASLEIVKNTVLGIFDAFSKLINFFRDVALKILDSVDKIFETFSNNFKWIMSQDPGHILRVAGAVTALGVAIASFGLSAAGGSVASAAGTLFNRVVNGKTPLESIIEFADKSEKLKAAADNVSVLSSALATFTQAKYGDDFVDQMAKVSKGIEQITNVKGLEKLGNLKYVTELKNVEMPAKQIEFNTNQTTPTAATTFESESVFDSLYISTNNLNDSIVELNTSLNQIRDRLDNSIKVQQQQAKLTDNSLGTLKEIRDKEQSGSNVVVNNSSSQMVLTQKSMSNLDFRRGLLAVNY